MDITGFLILTLAYVALMLALGFIEIEMPYRKAKRLLHDMPHTGAPLPIETAEELR